MEEAEGSNLRGVAVGLRHRVEPGGRLREPAISDEALNLRGCTEQTTKCVKFCIVEGVSTMSARVTLKISDCRGAFRVQCRPERRLIALPLVLLVLLRSLVV